ncbi:lactadherin-like [Liolophura sinensis]|uniref:lactadherin-like n=1 Tax=Liolophura sinensis TaxID=3198878 RepID=UPI0031596056
MAVAGKLALGLTLGMVVVQVIQGSFFDVEFPNVFIQAEPKGNLTLEAGVGGNVVLLPGNNNSGTVFIQNMDLRELVDRVKSLPPVWITKEEHDLLGTFLAGLLISVYVHAEDPEGGDLIYSVVSGDLPPGILLDPKTGHIYGTAPDEDATYIFGIRATDHHGKFADGIFRLEVREYNQCNKKPCQHGGSCTDLSNGYACSCIDGYGGERCEFDCVNHPLGVNAKDKLIPDAQMSAYLSEGTYAASNGRLNASGGWVGTGKGSWLQVDLGERTEVYAVAAQGYQSQSYYIASYELQTSEDGNIFSYITETSGYKKVFGGSQHYDSIIKHRLDFPVVARFVRFLPLTWKSNPGMRVEVYGCKV